MKDLIIVGAGGMGREVLQLIKDINKEENRWNILGFIDDNPDALKGIECTHRVIGSVAAWEPKQNQTFVCSIAAPEIKKQAIDSLTERGAKFETVIHPTAVIADNCTIGEGTVIYPLALVSVNARIGRYASVLSSLIGHDSTIGDYASIMGNCSINGGVQIGEGTYVGCNVATVPGRKIGRNAFVAAGSVVITNVRDGKKVMGNPARQYEL